jgi:hypothetical protein
MLGNNDRKANNCLQFQTSLALSLGAQAKQKSLSIKLFQREGLHTREHGRGNSFHELL